MATRVRSLLGIGVVALTVGLAGCELINDIIDDIKNPDPGGTACTSTAQCSGGKFCTVESGVCNPPPGCDPGEVCPAVCYGTCESRTGEPCGAGVCAPGQVCCNASCGICTEPGGLCTQQACDPPGAECRTDADCRTFAFMCTGCDCLALTTSEAAPICQGPGVQCFADPCLNKKAVCEAGQCAIATVACGAGEVARRVCVECGPAGGCSQERDCARTCTQDSECAPSQTRCIAGLCQVQGCI